jgi:AraC-like DNA-binding protein
MHFIPAFSYLLAFSPFLLLPADVKLNMFTNGFPGWFRPLQAVFNIVIILQGIFYSIYSLRTLHHFQYFRKSRFSALQMETINWLRFFVILNIALWIVGTTGAFLDIFGISIFIDLFKVFYSGLTFLTILLSIFTIRRPALFSENEDIRMFISQPVKPEKKSAGEPDMQSKDFQILKDHLANQKLYLKTDLKMQDLMQATGLSYKKISEIFNSEFNKSFFEVINEYRLEEALRLIKEDFHVLHTLPHLAEKAGFNSKATFNRVFKKYTGKTPTEYINSSE